MAGREGSRFLLLWRLEVGRLSLFPWEALVPPVLPAHGRWQVAGGRCHGCPSARGWEGPACLHTGSVLRAQSLQGRATAAHARSSLCPPPHQPRKLAPDSEDLAEDGVRAISISTLYLVSTTVDRMSDVSVWPAPQPAPGLTWTAGFLAPGALAASL